jgi:O-antigen/teichoic acid export membrane protein
VQNAGTTLGMDLLVRLRAGRIALSDLVRQAVAAALIVVGVATGADLIVFFAVLVPAALAGFAVVAISALRVGPGREPRRWAPLLRATIPFAIAAAASALFFRVAVVEMSLLASERDTGLFGASFRVVEVLSTLPALAVSAIFPVFSRRAAVFEQEQGLASAVSTTTVACAAAGVGLALGLALGAPAVIQVVAGPDFDGAIGVLRIQGLALAASFVAAPWGFALLSLGREHTLMWVNVLGVGAAAAVGAVLIEADGARGGAIATVVGETGLMIAFGVALALARPALTPALWPLVRPLLAGGVGALAFLLPLPAVPMALIGLAAYVVMLGLLGSLPSPRAFRRAP